MWPWTLAQTHIGSALPGQHVQLKTWLSKGLGTVHGWSLLLSFKAGHVQKGAAEDRGEQGTRYPFLYRILSGSNR